MAQTDPERQRQFAHHVVQQLQRAGHVAYLAGGCVRDQLLGREPKDFDVATSAHPEQIRNLFGERRTLGIGAAFGVITVLGPSGAGQIDVATFRSDDTYSDGRHPDRVTYSSAEEDARRRDFTINGMFFDPIAGAIIDYVGGQEDLRRGLVRAIGPAELRFAEDKLRMLRAVRFAAVLAFELDEATAAAVARMAPELVVVSAERIAMEMRRMLVDVHCARAATLLRQTGLLQVVLPGVRLPEGNEWNRTLRTLDHLSSPSFPLALAVLLSQCVDSRQPPSNQWPTNPAFAAYLGKCVTAAVADEIGSRWRLSGDETRRLVWLVDHSDVFHAARREPWPRLQRILIQPGAAELLSWCEARAAIGEFDPEEVAFCRERLSWPAERLDPPPLLTGDDLVARGVPRGSIYRILLDAVRDAQLLGQVQSQAEALALVDRLRAAESESR